MSDKYETLDFEDNHGDSLLNKSAGPVEPMEMEDHREEPTEDTLGDLMCRDKDIFADYPISDSQLESVVNASTPVDTVVPTSDAETGTALQTNPNFDWLADVEAQD